MWLLVIITLVTGTDGGASSSVTTLQFSTRGNCQAAAKTLAQSGSAGHGAYAIKASCVQP
jgi:hypothetical protein